MGGGGIEQFIERLFGEDLHARTILSLSNATLGVLYSVSLCIHVIGKVYAMSTGNSGKHGVKQVDRLLSNEKVSPWALAPAWIATLVGPREQVLVAVDWTDFAKDDHTTLVASLLTRHGRASLLLWKTVKKSDLKGKQSAYEAEFFEHLRDCMPEGVRTVIVADRGFGSQETFRNITELGMDYVIRFRKGILLTDEWGVQKYASEWENKNGTAKMLKDMGVTADCYIVPAIVLVHDKRMKQSWCLATNRAELTAADLVTWYGRRFTIEETFRDAKNEHFGMGLSATHIRNAQRRDRLIFIAALAHHLLTLLGAAGEKCGLDKTLKSNTSAKRQLSLFNQGSYWYMAIPNMRPARLQLLVEAYHQVLTECRFTRDLFALV